MREIERIESPYLLFLGNAQDVIMAKTAFGLVEWRPSDCAGQLRLPGCGVDIGLPDMSIGEAAQSGVNTLVIGFAPPGGALPEAYVVPLIQALDAGLDIASGLHVRLADNPALAEAAARTGRRLIDVRHPRENFAVATGARRTGKRLLTVGTDCAVGKKFTALAIHSALLRRGVAATFRATGQTGILIDGHGVAMDAVVSDFIAGAAEAQSPAAAVDHWDIIEGQGSLMHPAFAAVSLGVLHGFQPDLFIVCHEPTRKTMTAVSAPLPNIAEIIELTERLGRATSPDIRCAGLSINTANLDDAAGRTLIEDLQSQFNLPCVDPIRTGVEPIVEAFL
ncbi:DUF1611 domain-containing protein [Parasphingopyxis sp.]|uniref:DUF1611 domain-containing protein n=1 Tax=Parasphingopyxis sp. TaxID=1920299 RepID=UPI00260BE37B|nr:DUF1611 domain-containing protein [Parasphingopyxis sp.]